MKTRIIAGVLVFVAIVLLIVVSSALYTVSEMEQGVVTQFGEVKDVFTESGLKFKTPFVQKVRFFEKRIIEWDGEPTQVPTLGKKYITVNTWARWKIVDPERFYTSVTNMNGGQAVLDDQIESAVRDEISSLELEETVRSSSNREFEYVGEAAEEIRKAQKEIKVGRDNLVVRIKEATQAGLKKDYGMELVDVQIKRLNYVPRVREDVYSRMSSERERIAARYLSEARSKENEILGKMKSELDTIESEGYREAKIIKGEADAKAGQIYADAYGKAPEFYSFLRSLQSYESTLGDETVLVLTTGSAYFKHLVKEISKGEGPVSGGK